jgi:hypothetical protein
MTAKEALLGIRSILEVGRKQEKLRLVQISRRQGNNPVLCRAALVPDDEAGRGHRHGMFDVDNSYGNCDCGKENRLCPHRQYRMFFALRLADSRSFTLEDHAAGRDADCWTVRWPAGFARLDFTYAIDLCSNHCHGEVRACRPKSCRSRKLSGAGEWRLPPISTCHSSIISLCDYFLLSGKGKRR